MTCENCGGAVEMTDSTGGTKDGRFTERYQCVNCGALGHISGEAGAPTGDWDRRGRVFAEGER